MSDPSVDYTGQLLHQACIYGNLDFLADLISSTERSNVNCFDRVGRTVVSTCISNGSIDCCQLLLANGADVNLKSRCTGQTPIHQATAERKPDFVTLLIRYGADVLLEDGEGKTPLDYITDETCKSLLLLAADTQRVVLESASHGLHACLSSPATCDIALCEELANSLGAERTSTVINSASPDENSFLYRACLVRRTNLVKFLIEHGASSHYNTSTCETALHVACSTIDIATAEVILKNFPELIRVRTVSEMGSRLPIHVACEQGNVALVRLLLEFPYPHNLYAEFTSSDGEFTYRAPFDLNDVDIGRRTPIFNAVMSLVPELVQYLLDFFVTGTPVVAEDVDVPNKFLTPVDANCLAVDNLSPLYAAVQCGSVEIATLLLDHGANVNQRFHITPSGSNQMRQASACLIAAEKGDDAMMKLLLKYGVRDDDKAIARACHSLDNDSLLQILLLQRACKDTEHKAIAPLEDKQHDSSISTDPAAREIGDESGCSPATRPGDALCSVALNWDSVLLTRLRDDWLVSCGLRFNPSLPPTCRNAALAAITSIDVAQNGITQLPDYVLRMPSLAVLNVSGNALMHLPPSAAWQAPALTELALAHNEIACVPDELFQLASLERLDLRGNKLARVPFAMWLAPKLHELDLSGNLLEHLPDGTDDADGGSRNIGERFPAGTADGANQQAPRDSGYHTERLMEMLDLNQPGDRISQVPSPSADFVVVALPVAWQPGVKSPVSPDATAPVQINIWSSMRYMELSEVDGSSANSMEQRNFLRELKLSNNMFTAVPKGLPCLAPHLDKLDLSKNKLTSMGHPSIFPPHLSSLIMAHNAISRQDLSSTSADARTSLGSVVSGQGRVPSVGLHSTGPAGCRSSKQLCLSPYCTPSRPGSIGGSIGESDSDSASITDPNVDKRCDHCRSVRFEHLKNLDLADNKLSRFEFTTTIMRTDNTGKQETVDDVMFPKLTHLDLSKNALTALRKDVSRLSCLAQLVLSDNQIRDLPPEIGSLAQLWNLELKNCPLEGPLASMVEANVRTVDIMGFLKSILQEAKPYSTMKLMLVGISNIGKTTLLNELKKAASNPSRLSYGGEPLSTVGVDIGSLVIKKSKGDVTFKTWDFGGQEEYYATHQYFLTKRSLYLVLWKITDGPNAMRGIRQWLVNIQTRAPDSPVLIIGTHLDQAPNKATIEKMQALIESQFMNDPEPDKKGLPRVYGHMEINCKSTSDVKKTLRLIYDAAWALLAPGSKSTKLLDQKIPAVYVQLAAVVADLAEKQRHAKEDPVLTTEDYQNLVKERMESTFQQHFRDLDELKLATQFLHDNGVILHFNDVTLKNLYFLDPEWLSGILAKIVAVKEANPLAKNGLMNVSDIKLVYPEAAHQERSGWIIDLLSKFELALLLQNNVLLIPSLLPKEYPLTSCPAKIPLLHCLEAHGSALSHTWALQRQSSVYDPVLPVYPSSTDARVAADGLAEPGQTSTDEDITDTVSEHGLADLTRLYFLAFIPSGFWSRLLLHILNDKTFTALAAAALSLHSQAAAAAAAATAEVDISSNKAHWQCWDTGARLVVLNAAVLVVRQASSSASLLSQSSSSLDYSTVAVSMVSPEKGIRQLQAAATPSGDGSYSFFSSSPSSTASPSSLSSPWQVVELSVPAGGLFVLDNKTPAQQQPVLELRAKLLSKALYHVEALLEDWYPSLGLRFSQNLGGAYLVNRFVPCPWCVEDLHISHEVRERVQNEPGLEYSLDEDGKPKADSMTFSRLPLFGYLLDEVILSSHQGSVLRCPNHGPLDLAKYAPDVVFADLSYGHLGVDDLNWGSPFAKGAFGVVYKGLLNKNALRQMEVAIKTYEPVDKGMTPDVSESLFLEYQAAVRQWQQSPLQYATDAYFNARNEIDVMLALSHTGVVSLVGISLHPLSMVLPLAPHGSARAILDLYRREGRRLAASVVKRILVQIADALAYLHRESVIYRDLKADNVLVWTLPLPSQCNSSTADKVDVKLADYGISRKGTDAGAKGFAGTPGYMAPEIIEHGGAETYSEKVDCFSFGMFIYELLSLKRPFEDAEPQMAKEMILKGLRPKFTSKEAAYPCHFLDLLSLCWQQSDKLRPRAQEIVDLASMPQFDHLVQAVQSRQHFYAICALALPWSVANTDVANSGSLTTESYHPASLTTPQAPPAHQVVVFGGVLVPGETRWRPTASSFAYQHGQCIAEQSLSLGDQWAQVVCCLLAGSHIWLADEVGWIRVYDYKIGTGWAAGGHVTSFEAYKASSGASFIGLHHRASARDVVVITSDGTIWIRSNDSGRAGAELQLHKASSCDITCSLLLQERYAWLGRQWATIEVFCLASGSALRVLSHGTSFHEDIATTLLDTDEKEQQSVWSCVYPGSCVYRWDSEAYRVSSVDVTALICSHARRDRSSAQQSRSDEPCAATHQIRALKVLPDGSLVVATSQGHVAVLDALTFSLVTCFVPYGSQSHILQDIVALPIDRASTLGQYAFYGKQHLITFGHHYRSMMPRQSDGKQKQAAAPSGQQEMGTLCLLSWAVGKWKDF